MIVFTMRPLEGQYQKSHEVRDAWNRDEIFEIAYCSNWHFIGHKYRQSDLINGVSVRIEYAAGTKRITCKVRSGNV